MDELKPCPFCKSKAEHFSYNYSDYETYTVRCRYCLADCGEHDTPKKAAFVWNARPEENALKVEAERLKAEVERLKAKLWKIHDLTFMPRNVSKVVDMVHYISSPLSNDTKVPNKESDGGR